MNDSKSCLVLLSSNELLYSSEYTLNAASIDFKFLLACHSSSDELITIIHDLYVEFPASSPIVFIDSSFALTILTIHTSSSFLFDISLSLGQLIKNQISLNVLRMLD
jgi:hypothetical protein